MTSRLGFLAVLVLLTVAASASEAQQGESSATQPERRVIYHLVRLQSPSVQALRGKCKGNCGDEGGEIEKTIRFLGKGRAATTESLLNLFAIQLDGAAAEEHSCQIAKRGKTLLPALTRFDAARAADWCRATFGEMRRQELSGVKDVPAGEVCRPTKEIEQDRKEWLAALKSGQDLLAESGPC